MSVKSAALCLSVAIVLCPIATQAQSAADVIERHINAIGGKKAVEKIVSTDVSGSISAADGSSGVFIERTGHPHLFYVSMSWGDARWRTGFNGRSAWQDDSVDGVRTLYGQAAARVRAEASHATRHFMMSEKARLVSVTGRDQVRGRPVIVVVALTADGTKRTLFFDASSYLLAKDEQQTEAGVEERFFDDYRPVDEVMEPHRIEWHRNGETFRIAVERVTHNGALDGQMFDVPAAPLEPPADIAAVLSAAEGNEQRGESLRASYAYTATSTTARIDQQGRVTQTEGSSWEIVHLGGRSVVRLIRKRGGQPLSDAEQRREDERVNTIVQEYERQRLSGEDGRRGQEAPGGSGSVVVRMPLAATDWFPVYRRMSDFSNIRRERVRGRAVIVLDFQPKRGVAPKGDFERQASTMAGTMWIDDASRHVTRMESYFREDYNRTVQGSSLRVERTLVNDEVWLPSRNETNLRMSLAFGNFSLSLGTVQYADHKKFRVETDSTLTRPDPGR